MEPSKRTKQKRPFGVLVLLVLIGTVVCFSSSALANAATPASPAVTSVTVEMPVQQVAQASALAPAAPATYTVQDGDTLSKVFGDDWLAVYHANSSVIGPNPNVIRAGMVLTLNGPATPAQASSASPVTFAPPARDTSGFDLDNSSIWDKLAKCESTNNWGANTGNSYYGGLQFSAATWRAYKGTDFAAFAHQATREEQITVANRVHKARGGFGDWPACSRKLGLPQ
jgi:hypothetical protein